MKQKFSRKYFFNVMLVITGLLLSNGSSAATFTNGDFSSGFNGWGGAVGSSSGINIVDPNTNPSNFNISSGAALLTSNTSLFGGNSVVNIFQTFVVQSLLSPSNTLLLGFDFTKSFDDITDVFLAQIVESGNLSHAIDLSSGGSFDITSFAGKNVELRFGLENVASPDGSNDSLTIDNIFISQNQVSVPEPTTILLIGAGLMAMRRKFI